MRFAHDYFLNGPVHDSLKLLNLLLDEVDFLRRELQTLLQEGDFKRADVVQRSLFYKNREIDYLEGIVSRVRKDWRPTDKFYVNSSASSPILAKYLKEIVGANSPARQLNIKFYQGYSYKSLSDVLSIINLKQERQVFLKLLKVSDDEEVTGYNGYERAKLKMNGWKLQNDLSLTLTLRMERDRKALLGKLTLAIAQVVFEAIEKTGMKTELEVINF